MDDSELLRRYLHDRSQAAFTELVQRHLPLVYRAALRQADGNSAQAEEVSQSVFILLARKAPSLLRHPTLAGWLHTTVYFAASDSQRASRRRRWHEQEASRMTEPFASDEPPDWAQFQPVIDGALQRLDPKDRDAVLLRFFEDRPFGEIAQRLDLKEDAARMRVNRALARLRGLLASRGIRSTEAALAGLLAAEAAAAPAALPAALTASVAQAAFAAAQATVPAASVLSFTLMSAKKSLILAAAVALLIGALGSAFLFRRHLWSANAQISALQAENDALRDKLTAAMLAGPTASARKLPSAAGANDPASRLDAIHSQVRLHEASRDALPTTVAHPLKFRGYDTPIHAVESFAWAGYHSDSEALARQIYLDDAAREATEKIRTSLPPEVQAQYPTPESLIAMCIAYDVIRHPGPNNEDIFIDAPEPTYTDPDDFKVVTGHTYHKTADGWKFAFPARAVTVFVNGVLHPSPKNP